MIENFKPVVSTVTITREKLIFELNTAPRIPPKVIKPTSKVANSRDSRERGFTARPSDRRNLKTSVLRFRVDGKHYDNHVISRASLPQIQDDQRLFLFEIPPPAKCARKSFDVFSK